MNYNLMLLGYGVFESFVVLEYFVVVDVKNLLNGVVFLRLYIVN